MADKELQRSPLFEHQRSLGARFCEISGWEMAESYYCGSAKEHETVRSAAGLVDLSYCGAIRVSGREATQFLNGLVTNNVKTLAVGKGMRAAFLTGHGKVKALCRVFNLGNAYLVITDAQTHRFVFEYLFPFSYAGDFNVEDVSERFRLVSLQGPASQLIVKEVCFEPLPCMDENDWTRSLIAGHSTMVVRASQTGEVGFDVFVEASSLVDVWDFILLKGSFHSVVPFGLRAQDSLRIEAGMPVYGVDIDETNMMLETNLIGAISLEKGCYTGQEAVAMATYRGHVSKRLSGLVIASDLVPPRGSVVRIDEKEIGVITSALKSPSLGSVIALAYLKYGFFEPGTNVQVECQGQRVPASIVELPFYRARS